MQKNCTQCVHTKTKQKYLKQSQKYVNEFAKSENENETNSFYENF